MFRGTAREKGFSDAPNQGPTRAIEDASRHELHRRSQGTLSRTRDF